MSELLIPAGNFDKMKIAIHYGADAVYLAGDRYSLRSGADNFSLAELKEATDYAHLHQVKVYVTLNAFLLNTDFLGLQEYISYLDEIQVDAVICSDLGVIEMIKKHSNLKIHLSTQASVLNSYHARVWKELGVKRIVLAREASILEAMKIKEASQLEVEIFVHGAMCMSYSGHCTISNYTAGRDSNRGGCIQSCRHNYVIEDDQNGLAEEYIMSSKDLNTLRLLPKIVEYGIDSMKVEGRMKSYLYVSSIARAYSNVKNGQIKNNQIQSWLDELKKLPHRDYTEGSLEEQAGKDSIYNGDRSAYDHYKLAGIVIEYNQKLQRCYFQCLHKLTSQDTIEILNTDLSSLDINLETMRDLQHQLIDIAQPGSIIQFDYPQSILTYSVARFDITQSHKRNQRVDLIPA